MGKQSQAPAESRSKEDGPGVVQNKAGKDWKRGRVFSQLRRGSRAHQEPQLCSAMTHTGWGGANCRQPLPSPCRGSGTGHCVERDSATPRSSQPAAGRRGWIPGVTTGNTDDCFGGAILTASQEQESTVAHGGTSKASLPP